VPIDVHRSRTVDSPLMRRLAARTPVGEEPSISLAHRRFTVVTVARRRRPTGAVRAELVVPTEITLHLSPLHRRAVCPPRAGEAWRRSGLDEHSANAAPNSLGSGDIGEP